MIFLSPQILTELALLLKLKGLYLQRNKLTGAIPLNWALLAKCFPLA